MNLIPNIIHDKKTECPASGPLDARVMIIGEHPTDDDARTRIPFSGDHGNVLSSWLAAIGMDRNQCYVTHLSKIRPPYKNMDRLFANPKKNFPDLYLTECREVLLQEIEHVRPDLIITLGPYALWSIADVATVTKWRGSQLTYTFKDGGTCWHLPTYSPKQANAMRVWNAVAMMDLRRAARYTEWKEPDYEFILRPTFTDTMDFLSELETRARSKTILVSGDLETRAGHTACFGIGVSKTRALCIPFMDINKSDSHYWNEAEEVSITQGLVSLFKNPNVLWAFQNGTFDYQYYARHWGAIPHLATDTMLEHHVAWAGDLPKGLDYLSSMYCDWHQYWKEDGKFWDPRYTPEEQLWEYNCKDSVVTWEVAAALGEQTSALGFEEQVLFQTQRQFLPVVKMMMRGVRCDKDQKARFSYELQEAEKEMQKRLEYLTGGPLNVKSPKQMCEFFYEELGLPVQKKRNAKGQMRPTTDAKALPKLANKAAWIKPITDLVATMRSVGVFKSTFVDMELDADDRIRCSYNIAGTETFRYSSSANAFGSGTNLQNIPKGNEGKGLPNVKNLFIPDEDYIIAEHDLAQADAQIVAWEADDAKLKYIFREGIDLHLANASDMYNLGIKLSDISEPDGIEYYAQKFSKERQFAKAGCHATNYGASAYTLGITLGISTADAQAFIDRWFSEHPNIRAWQEATELSLQTRREVRNAFGFRRYYFDRIEGLLPEGLAWVPQSSVALVIDKGLVNIDENIPEVQPLLQVHDSLIVQYPKAQFHELLPRVHEAMLVPIPYEDPLTIPVGVEVSAERWGAKKEIPWDFKGEVTW